LRFLEHLGRSVHAGIGCEQALALVHRCRVVVAGSTGEELVAVAVAGGDAGEVLLQLGKVALKVVVAANELVAGRAGQALELHVHLLELQHSGSGQW